VANGVTLELDTGTTTVDTAPTAKVINAGLPTVTVDLDTGVVATTATLAEVVLDIAAPSLVVGGQRLAVTVETGAVPGPQGPQGPPGPGLGDPESITLTYAAGRLSTVTSATTVRTLAYDGDGKLVTVDDSAAGWTKTLAYTGDLLTSVTVS